MGRDDKPLSLDKLINANLIPEFLVPEGTRLVVEKEIPGLYRSKILTTGFFNNSDQILVG